MSVAIVCSASLGYRSVCGAECHDCHHIVPDRRQGVVGTMAAGERRLRSNWIPRSALPGDYGMLDAGGTGPAAARGFVMLTVALLLLFNLFDVMLTLRAFSLGFGEANPFMAGLFNISLPLGVTIKLLLVGGGALVLWRLHHVSLARRGMVVLTGCYGAVVTYHLYFQLLI